MAALPIAETQQELSVTLHQLFDFGEVDLLLALRSEDVVIFHLLLALEQLVDFVGDEQQIVGVAPLRAVAPQEALAVGTEVAGRRLLGVNRVEEVKQNKLIAAFIRVTE